MAGGPAIFTTISGKQEKVISRVTFSSLVSGGWFDIYQKNLLKAQNFQQQIFLKFLDDLLYAPAIIDGQAFSTREPSCTWTRKGNH